MALYEKTVTLEDSGPFIQSGCTVTADDEGYFITVCTDAYEGNALMTLPVAEQVYKALREAIGVAQFHRQDKGLPLR